MQMFTFLQSSDFC